ncbi:MAG: hypothetical protein HDR01_10900 [Lachnospiraceae bacterium]|nr:hypothetical protein [Lachnospiraceae bacterium]
MANPSFCSQDGVLYTKDKSVLYNFPCAKSTATYRVPATVDHICCTAFASARYLNKLYLDGKNTYWAGFTFYNTGQMTIYYLPGGRSELYARRHVENGRSNESDSLYPKYSLASEEKKEEKDSGEDEGNHSGSGISPENGNDQAPEQEKITIGKNSLKTLKNQAGRKAKVNWKSNDEKDLLYHKKVKKRKNLLC